MFYNNINPVLAQIGPIHVRYYGLLFAAGAVIAYLIFSYLARKKGVIREKKELEQLLLYELLGMLIGARLLSVMSQYSYYLEEPSQIIAVWNGGMAFHGGLIGMIIGGLVFCRQYKKDFYELADLLVIPLGIALMLGRIANYLNSEFYGKITSVPWAVKFEGIEGFRHPVQLYEAAKNLLIFALLWAIKDKSLKKGALFWTFILSYGTLRFFLEFFKELPTLMGLTWGQWWSVPMIISGIYMLYRKL